MRVLLVNPYIHDFAAFDLWAKPLGLLKIAGFLKELKCEISLIDCLDRLDPSLNEFLKGKAPKSSPFGSGQYYSEEIIKPDLYKSVPRKFKRHGMPPGLFKKILGGTPKPDIILVTSGMTYWYPGVFETIEILKHKFPGVPLILGGIYANICTKHAKEKSGADIVFSGNNIFEILKLISTLTKTEFDHSRLKKDDEILPYYELYPKLSYITLRTSSGCPFKCSYCGWYLLEDKFHQMDPCLVVGHIEYFNKKYDIRNFAFYDEALLYNAENHVIKILQNVINRNLQINFHTPNGLHARFMTLEIAKLMKRAGFIQPRLALETTKEERQKQTGFKTSTKEFMNAVECLKSAGFAPQDIAVNILIGLPGRDFSEIKDSIEFVAKLGQKIFLEEYSPIPGTNDFESSGLTADSDPLLHNNSIFPLFKPEDLPVIQSLKKLAHDHNQKNTIR
ncbi:MAG: radical SAM protein [bacterium]|nr:radical SAM protein [bacterium]